MEQQTDRLAEIQEREKRATKGPWSGGALPGVKIFALKEAMTICDIRGWGYLTGTGGLHLSEESAEAVQVANSEFISHAREDVPYLVAEVQSLRAERDLLAQQVAEMVAPEELRQWQEATRKAEAERDTLLEALAKEYQAGVTAALVAVRRDVEQYLYTNTKSGNRDKMLNVVARVVAAFSTLQRSPQTAEETQGK